MYLENNFHPLLMICKHCLLRAYFLSNASVHSVLYAECFNFLNFLILYLNSVIVGPTYTRPLICYYWVRHVWGWFFVRRIHFSETRPPRGIVLSPSIFWTCFYICPLWSKFLSSWDDLSTLWTCFISVHFGLNFYPLRMIRSLCEHVLSTSILDFKSLSS